MATAFFLTLKASKWDKGKKGRKIEAQRATQRIPLEVNVFCDFLVPLSSVFYTLGEEQEMKV